MEGTTEAQLLSGKKRITIQKEELLSLHINISLVFKSI